MGRGTVLSCPEVSGTHTQFQLETAEGIYTVVRRDLYWQKRDILFLSCGQLVEVTGMLSDIPEGTVTADTITITGNPETRYIQTKE